MTLYNITGQQQVFVIFDFPYIKNVKNFQNPEVANLKYNQKVPYYKMMEN